MAKLDQEQINAEIEKLKGWSSEGDWIVKEFQFEKETMSSSVHNYNQKPYGWFYDCVKSQ